MRRILLPFLALMVVNVVAPTTRAADAGDPIFPLDLQRLARAEFIYEARERDLDSNARFEADVFTLRIHTDVGQYASLDFDVGGMSPSGGDLEFYGGLGLRLLAYDGESLRISPYAQAHYAPSMELKGDSYEDLIDADAGLLFAAKLKPNDQLTIMPYAGPALSILRMSGDGTDPGEDNMLGAVGGVSLLMPGMNTFRIEAQYFDRVSISVAAGIAF